MCDEEMEQIHNADDINIAFTSLWTQKEALLKLTGEGITDDLKTVLRSSRMDGVNMQTIVNSDKGYCVSIATTIQA
jgi:4'-phosphopantetheinyl transferase